MGKSSQKIAKQETDRLVSEITRSAGRVIALAAEEGAALAQRIQQQSTTMAAVLKERDALLVALSALYDETLEHPRPTGSARKVWHRAEQVLANYPDHIKEATLDERRLENFLNQPVCLG